MLALFRSLSHSTVSLSPSLEQSHERGEKLQPSFAHTQALTSGSLQLLLPPSFSLSLFAELALRARAQSASVNSPFSHIINLTLTVALTPHSSPLALSLFYFVCPSIIYKSVDDGHDDNVVDVIKTKMQL